MVFIDEVIFNSVLEAHGKQLDLLLGRRTYDIWSAYWPKAEKGPISDPFNAATKYVATHHPESLTWGPVQDLGKNIIEGIRAIKSKAGPDIILWGSSTLAPVLIENGLADEIILIVCPVLLGKGKRFFADSAAPSKLELVSTKTASTGVIMSTYKYVGPLKTEA